MNNHTSKIMDEIENNLEKERLKIKMAIGEILDMFFWNDSWGEFADLDERDLIIDYIFNKYSYQEGFYQDDGYYMFEDKNKLLDLVNKIRKNMGLWDYGDDPPEK